MRGAILRSGAKFRKDEATNFNSRRFQEPSKPDNSSSQNPFYYLTMDIGQAEIAAGVAEREAGMIQS